MKRDRAIVGFLSSACLLYVCPKSYYLSTILAAMPILNPVKRLQFLQFQCFQFLQVSQDLS